MISDTLHDAAAKIRDDLAAFPAAFADSRAEILAVLAQMDRLRSKLDTPPTRESVPVGRLISIEYDGAGVERARFYRSPLGPIEAAREAERRCDGIVQRELTRLKAAVPKIRPADRPKGKKR